jgi:NADPH:quinone reductase-like Zn-dependent oxidoreductase
MITIHEGVQTMKAIVCERPGKPGDVKLRDVDRPEVGEDGVLIRVHASSVNPVDVFPTTTAGYLMGGRKPKVLGTDYAGTVEAVGKTVTGFQPGDHVFGGGRGALAEYKMAPAAGSLAPVPAGVSLQHAGTVAVAATTALQALRDHGRIQRGQKVLINGASGGVGTFAVQIAKALGAEVTAVCGTRNVDMVRSIGADHVVDYTREDFARAGQRYDLMLDMVGNHSPSDCRRALTPVGTLVLVGGPNEGRWLGPLPDVLGAVALSWFARQRLRPMLAHSSKDDLAVIQELLAAGKVTPVIDRIYPLSGVPEAIRYLEEGHARGKVVITNP